VPQVGFRATNCRYRGSVLLLRAWFEPGGSTALTQFIQNRRGRAKATSFNRLTGRGKRFVQGAAFGVGEVVTLVVDDQTYNHAFGQVRRLIEHEPTILHARLEMTHVLSLPGSGLACNDGWLREEGIHEGVAATAIKQVLARQVEAAMKEKNFTKAEMARRMHTSRAAVDRLLDPEYDAVTLSTLRKAATAVGRELRLELR
jgi:predicted XRE-type DNA-binding protein